MNIAVICFFMAFIALIAIVFAVIASSSNETIPGILSGIWTILLVFLLWNTITACLMEEVFIQQGSQECQLYIINGIGYIQIDDEMKNVSSVLGRNLSEDDVVVVTKLESKDTYNGIKFPVKTKYQYSLTKNDNEESNEEN